MAAIWTAKIDVTDAVRKVMSVVVTRTDGTDIRTYGLAGLSYATAPGRGLPEIRAELAVVFHAMYEAQRALTVATADVATQEALLSSALNAMEV